MSIASRMLLFLALCLSVLPLAGCWDRVEVNDLAIITAAGMDTGKDDFIKLTVLVVVPKSSNGGQQIEGGGGRQGGGGGAQQTLVRSAEGRTIAEALSKLQQQFPRRLFWGHTGVWIISEELARKDIRPQFDYILRHPQLRIRSHVFVSREDAKEVLSLIPPIERDLSETLKESAVQKIGMDVTTKDLAQMLISESSAAALPYIKILPAQPGQDEKNTLAYSDGTAVFNKGKMVGTINERATRGLLWLRDEMKRAMITVKPHEAEGYVSMNLLRSKSRLEPKIKNGIWQITLHTDLALDVNQNTTRLEISDPKITRMLEQQTSAEVERRVQEVLEIVQKEMKTDIPGFAEVFHRAYPSIWKKNKERWDEIFPNVEVTYDINARVKRSGMVNQPAMIPEEEIKNKLEER